MSNSSKKDKELEKIDEDQAYFELCQIIAEAIQTQDINLLNARIADWKRRYPWDKFSKNLKAKIEYILNQYYSELIQYIIKSIKEQDEKKEFNQRKALLELYKTIKKTNDLTALKKEVEKWKSKYPIDSFMKMYQKKAREYISQSNLQENAFDQEKAFHDLYYTLKTNSTFEELKVKVADWEKEYSIGDKFKTEDFVKHENDVKHLLDEEYLNSISTDSSQNNASAEYKTVLSIQQSSYSALVVALSTGDNLKVFDWVYKNKDLSFNSYYKNQILVKTAFKYPVSILESAPKLGINLNNSELSFDEFQNIDNARKFIIIKFIKFLMDDNSLPNETFQTAFKKSELAKRANFTEPVLENVEIIDEPNKENKDEINIVETPLTPVENTSEFIEEIIDDDNTLEKTEDIPEENIEKDSSVEINITPVVEESFQAIENLVVEKKIEEPIEVLVENNDYANADVNVVSVENETLYTENEIVQPIPQEISPQIEFSDTPLFEINTEIKEENPSEITETESDFEFTKENSQEIEPLDLIYRKSQLAKATIIVEDTIDRETTVDKKRIFGDSLTNLFNFKNRNEIQ